MVLSASPVQSATSSLLDQIADELLRDQNLTRIRKLLLYTCTGAWETDPHRLNRVTLRSLVQRLFELCPTFEQLQQRLHQIVASLNKSNEYTLIANTVIARFQVIYGESQQSQLTTQAIDQGIYQLMGQRLQQLNPVRVKKLLLLTCRNIWESNTCQLEQLDVALLIQELHQLAPTPQSLEQTLHQVAATLSKPEEYTALAKQISDLLKPLYQAAPLHRLPPVPTPNSQTEVLLHQPVSPLPQSARTHLKVIRTELPKAPESTAQAIAKPALRVLRLAKSPKPSHLFDLRLALMHDTNPFKAKILLFSLLHEPFRAEHEALLKTHELDELLRILFLSYRLYSDVVTGLRQIAQSLGSKADYLSADYLSTAEAILRAVQPFYAESPTEPLPPPVAEVTGIQTDIEINANQMSLTGDPFADQ
jgi:hypothetical protein